jgi:hypothetical protein
MRGIKGTDMDGQANEADLRRKLAHAEEEKEVLQGMLRGAASELEHIVVANCSEASKDEALDAATRLRRAAAR